MFRLACMTGGSLFIGQLAHKYSGTDSLWTPLWTNVPGGVFSHAVISVRQSRFKAILRAFGHPSRDDRRTDSGLWEWTKLSGPTLYWLFPCPFHLTDGDVVAGRVYATCRQWILESRGYNSNLQRSSKLFVSSRNYTFPIGISLFPVDYGPAAELITPRNTHVSKNHIIWKILIPTVFTEVVDALIIVTKSFF